MEKKAIRKINNNPKKILDIATGTGELAIIAAKYTDAIITALDISKSMIDIGLQKKKTKFIDGISFLLADAKYYHSKINLLMQSPLDLG